MEKVMSSYPTGFPKQQLQQVAGYLASGTIPANRSKFLADCYDSLGFALSQAAPMGGPSVPPAKPPANADAAKEIQDMLSKGVKFGGGAGGSARRTSRFTSPQMTRRGNLAGSKPEEAAVATQPAPEAAKPAGPPPWLATLLLQTIQNVMQAAPAAPAQPAPAPAAGK
jgi:hypothetical protein